MASPILAQMRFTKLRHNALFSFVVSILASYHWASVRVATDVPTVILLDALLVTAWHRRMSCVIDAINVLARRLFDGRG
jgi:hypothetical protein